LIGRGMRDPRPRGSHELEGDDCSACAGSQLSRRRGVREILASSRCAPNARSTTDRRRGDHRARVSTMRNAKRRGCRPARRARGHASDGGSTAAAVAYGPDRGAVYAVSISAAAPSDISI
jgi:hypothetical protein